MAPSATTTTAVSTTAAAKVQRADADTDTDADADDGIFLLNRSLSEPPHLVASASGSYLQLEDGRRILDACGGAAVAVLGHGNAEVAAAVATQMGCVSYVHTQTYGTRSAEDLARSVLSRDSAEFDHGLVKAYFISSGSEANDAAMKCARQYWVEKGEPQRRFIVARRRAYHGNTIGAMSLSSLAARKAPYVGALLLPNVTHVSPADAFHGRQTLDEDDTAVTARLLDELDATFRRLGPQNVMSFVGETVSGAALGSMPAPRGYWAGVRRLCDRYGILLHLDEVMCGSGRTGTYFAFAQADGGVRPDLVTIGKGLGGGYAPIAGLLVNARIVRALRHAPGTAFNHGHTYQAHPVACAAALAVQTILRRDGLVARVADLGRRVLQPRLVAVLAGATYVADIRGAGFFWSVEFLEDPAGRRPFAPGVRFSARVLRAAWDRGVALYPGPGTGDGEPGDHVTLAPPYTATEAELELMVTTLREAYDEIAQAFAVEAASSM